MQGRDADRRAVLRVRLLAALAVACGVGLSGSAVPAAWGVSSVFSSGSTVSDAVWDVLIPGSEQSPPDDGGEQAPPPTSVRPPMSDRAAASRVRRSRWEPRRKNRKANRRVPKRKELRRFRKLNRMPARYKKRITGRFRGTTDEILQWAAYKWGLDVNLVRAAAVQESWWRMNFVGDNGQSFGIMQIKRTASKGTHPLSRRSTAFNVDYYGASIRYYYDGNAKWLNRSRRGRDYTRGDLWGAVGAWYAGRWYTPGARWYIDRVRSRLEERTWRRRGF